MITGTSWGEEFVVERPDTPLPWANVLTNGRYLLRISNLGAGESYLLGKTSVALTRSVEDTEQADLWPSRFVFLRDNDTGNFWRITGEISSGASYQARHGANHTVITTSQHECESQITYMLDPTEPLEIWQIKIKNLGKTKRRLSLFSFVEWPGARAQTLFLDEVLYLLPQTTDRRFYGFISLNHPADSFDGARSAFIGQGSRVAPEAVKDGKCSRSLASGEAAVGALQKQITLGSQGETTLCVFLGGEILEPSQKTAPGELARRVHKRLAPYRQSDKIEQVGTINLTSWQDLRDRITINTPDHQLNHSFNQWLKYQSHLSLNHPLEDHSGEMDGTIAALEGVINIASLDCALAWSHLQEILSNQSHNGVLLGAKDPLSAGYLLVEVILAILLERGDSTTLGEELPFADYGKGSTLQHLELSINHRLSLIDDSGLVARDDKEVELTDSLKLAHNLRLASPILLKLGESHLSRRYEAKYEELVKQIEKRMWLGHWFATGRSRGKKYGTSKDDCAKISLSAQSWAVIAGVGTPVTRKTAISSALKRLQTQYGLASTLPACEMTQCCGNPQLEVPGSESNGGIQTRETSTALHALAHLGMGDELYRIWRQTNGFYRTLTTKGYAVEPYAYPPFVYGPDSSRFGRGVGAGNLWSSPGLLWRVILEQMMGIQPTLGGLKINPCIPRDWRIAEVTRTFRGAHYQIRIINSLRVNSGVDRIIVDGLRLIGDVVKPFTTGTHYIEVFLG